MKCSICLNNIIYIYKIKECNHSFCNSCIYKLANHKTNNRKISIVKLSCPLCRTNFTYIKPYKTRSSDYLTKRNTLLNMFNECKVYNFSYESRKKHFNKVMNYIYNNISMLKSPNFKKAVFDKIFEIKNENYFEGFYWEIKLNNLIRTHDS